MAPSVLGAGFSILDTLRGEMSVTGQPLLAASGQILVAADNRSSAQDGDVRFVLTSERPRSSPMIWLHVFSSKGVGLVSLLRQTLGGRRRGVEGSEPRGPGRAASSSPALSASYSQASRP